MIQTFKTSKIIYLMIYYMAYDQVSAFGSFDNDHFVQLEVVELPADPNALDRTGLSCKSAVQSESNGSESKYTVVGKLPSNFPQNDTLVYYAPRRSSILLVESEAYEGTNNKGVVKAVNGEFRFEVDYPAAYRQPIPGGWDRIKTPLVKLYCCSQKRWFEIQLHHQAEGFSSAGSGCFVRNMLWTGLVCLMAAFIIRTLFYSKLT